MSRFLAMIINGLSSFWLSVSTLFFLFLITYLGTVYQVEHGLYAAQQQYFESWVLIQPVFGPVSIPLPGGFLLMALLMVNLTCGGIVRLRKSWTRFGILVTHLGIVLMLAAGFVKFAWSDEGGIQLFEGQSAAEYVSYHEIEIAIYEPISGNQVREHLIAGESFIGAGGDAHRFADAGLPFELTVSRYLQNCRPRPAGPRHPAVAPAVDGFLLEELPPRSENELNRSGCYVSARDLQSGEITEGLIWVGASQPMTVSSGGRRFGIDLRKKRFPLPFRLELKDFTRELHPGTNTPRKFMSDVTVADGDVAETLRIQMNEPLRREGFIVFQSSWGPQNAGPDARLFSGFAVVRNPADQWPLISCLVIAAGMLIHFGRSLFRHVRSELRRSS